ncbi:MAG: hypothetical protein KDB03_22090 [Planctomycetales bacterium]|nr:hypothetical protein [Planctomycetales bacterium]
MSSSRTEGKLQASISPDTFSGNLRSLISVLLLAHFLALLLTWSSNLAPSELQLRLNSIFKYYLVPTGQVYGGIPLEITHGEELDFPIFFDIGFDREGATHWVRLPTPSSLVEDSALDSRWASYSRACIQIWRESPNADVFADLAVLVVRRAAELQLGDCQYVRIVRPHVLTRSEASLSLEEVTRPIVRSRDEVLYQCQLTPLPNGVLRVTPILETKRTAKSVHSAMPPRKEAADE